MTQTFRRTRSSMISRKALMISCASAALASVAPQAANAQAFSGGIIGTTGSVTRTPTSSTTETITIGSNTATINWNAGNQQGGTVNFLPNGNTATFTSSSGITDYTVLNRVLPESGLPISINGRVISTLQGTSTTGGHIWFYSPAGIVVGATAVFDVGGLLLTTNDVTSFGTTANGFNASFSGTAGSTSKIQIMPGAEINALQQNSYVALVAPRIEQGGKVRVNGTAAYAAGEQLSMTMNQGLFDIQVDVGTGDPNGIVHTGETSGPANATTADNHKIYMVAVPKNQALTMLLGGKVGFDDAVSANVRNGQIFLSSGWGVQDSDGSAQYYTSTPGLNAGISIGPGNYTSDVLALGQGTLTAAADTGDITFGGNVELNSWSGTGPIDASLVASDGHHLTIVGDADLRSSGYTDWGSSSITASSGGSVSIGGAANLSSWDGSSGGNASLSADGGSISIAGATHIYAAGVSDPQAASETDGTDARGGRISVEAANGGSITTGAMQLDAYANGQASVGTGTAGDGHGGFISIGADNDGRITVNGDLTANANGIGGNARSQGGTGDGGQTNLFVNGGDITVHGDLTLLSNGFGGGGQTAGNGFGGSTSALFTGGEGVGQGGSLTIDGDLSMQAAGTGGNGTDHSEAAGGQGGDGYAGSAFFYVSPNLAEGDTVTIDIANTEVFANGTGGNGGNGLIGGDAGSGYAYSSDGEGGFFNGGATLELWAGTLTTGDLLVYSTARGGNGGNGSSGVGGQGGDAYGGTSDITVGGNLTAGRALSYARALAGSGGSGSTEGDGGYASGGSSSIDVVQGGRLTGAVDLSTGASGGAGNTGGDASGGFSRLNVEGTLTASTAAISSTAQGGNGVVQGGHAGGGTANFDVSDGTATLTGVTTLDANAFGGNASSGHGGFAGGGSADLAATNGGSLAGHDLAIGASGTGGNGTIAGGGSGGEIDVAADSSGSELPTAMSFAEANLTANGNLGAGGRGGETDGVGGSITVESSGASIIANQLSLQANGTGSGGVIALQSGPGFDGLKGTLQFGGVHAVANGGDNGGLIVVASGSGSIIDLGKADLTTSGGFGGLIYLLAGTCVQCGGGEEMAPLSAPLPGGGGIAASDLTLNTTGNIVMALSGGADISVSGKLLGNAGQFISITDDGTGGAIRAHDIELSAVLIQDDADIIADIIKFTSSGTMTLGNLSATDTMTLTAGGDLITGDLSAGNALTLTAGNDVDTGNLAGQAVKVTATRDLTVGDVNAPGSATFTAGGLATFDGTVSAPTITVTSSDIDIGDGASLGVSGVTNLITLNAVANGLPIVIGDGPAAEGQYHLDEDGDIRTASLVVNAVGSEGSPKPDVNVFDTQIEGSATTAGGVGNVTLNTGGSVFVEGDVRFINAGAADKLTINAGSNIEVNTDSGSIVITDAAGHLAGTLALNASNVWIASQAILDQLEADPNFTGRDTALGTNPGTANQDGFVRAGAISAGVANTFLVQNSGTADLFAGIDTGPGGLSVQSTGNTPAVVVIYGRQTDATGAVITNQDFLNTVALSGTGGFTQDSAVNGCPIAGSCAQTTFTVDMSSILGPLDETNSPDDQKKKKDKKGEDSEDGSSADPNLRLINTTPINLDRTIDEPVTSGGDVVVGGINQPN